MNPELELEKARLANINTDGGKYEEEGPNWLERTLPGVTEWWKTLTTPTEYHEPMSLEEMNPKSTPLAAVQLREAYNSQDNKTIFGQSKPVRVPYTSKEHGAGTLYINSQTGGEVKFSPTELNQAAHAQTAAQFQTMEGVQQAIQIAGMGAVGVQANRARIRQKQQGYNLAAEGAKNITPGQTAVKPDTTAGQIVPQRTIEHPGYDAGYAAILKIRRPNPGATAAAAQSLQMMNAQSIQALGQGKPTSQPQADAGRTIYNKEAQGLAQTSKRGEKAEWGSDYHVSDPNLYNPKYLLARGIGESHHVGDHDFVGGLAQTLGKTRGQTLLTNLQNDRIRTGNDAYQMITIPGKGSGKGARFDHVGLMHKRWYPQIDTRQQLVQAAADGTLLKWSDSRIAKLTASTIRTQQRITIGWAKWKLDTVRKLYPETMYFKPKEMRAWLEQNPQKFAAAGGDSAPESYVDIMNYGRTKGQDNYSNAYLREVFNVQYGGRSAAQGLEHPIPAKNRQRLSITGQKKTAKH